MLRPFPRRFSSSPRADKDYARQIAPSRSHVSPVLSGEGRASGRFEDGKRIPSWEQGSVGEELSLKHGRSLQEGTEHFHDDGPVSLAA